MGVKVLAIPPISQSNPPRVLHLLYQSNETTSHHYYTCDTLCTMNTQQLVSALISRGMTQKRIAAAIGCTQAAVSLWLSGKREAGGKYYVKLMGVVNG